MYPVLSFQLPAKSDISQDAVIRAFWQWVSDSQYYHFGATQLEDILNSNFYNFQAEHLITKEASLQLIRLSAEGRYYIAAQLDKPDVQNNLLWQARCIFEQEEKKEAPGTFHISLNRGVLQNGQPANISCLPMIPDIVKILLRGQLAAGIDDDQVQAEKFPRVLVGIACTEGHKAFMDKLETYISLIAQIKADGEHGIRIIYPAATIKRTYPAALLASGDTAAVELITWDVFHMVSEIHSSQTVSWEWLQEQLPKKPSGNAATPGTQGAYCYMNQAMASRLKQARRQQAMSQNELAQAVNSSGLIISRLETTRVQRVLRSLLNDIERALGLPENDIVSLQNAESGTSQGAADAAEALPSSAGADGQTPPKSGYCRLCGTHLYKDSRYCPKCGTKVLL
ncbi:MAG: helix-turn-helix domain-containing protein [Oscillospiraceae bacterium]